MISNDKQLQILLKACTLQCRSYAVDAFELSVVVGRKCTGRFSSSLYFWDGYGGIKGRAPLQMDSTVCRVVRPVPVLGSGGSSAKRFFSVFQYSLTAKDGSGFGFGENGSGGSGSAFGFGKSGSDGSGFRFRFGSSATLCLWHHHT